MSELGQNISTTLHQHGALTPQMQQSLAMLQMTALELRAELQHQMATNPVIEDIRNSTEVPLSVVTPDEVGDKADGDTARELDFTPDGEAAERTLSATDGRLDYFMGNLESASGDEGAQTRRQRLFDSQVKELTLFEHLVGQLGLSDIAAEDRKTAEILIGELDEDGRFRGSLPDIVMATGGSEKELVGILEKIMQLDPLGCGARDLRECLLAQMAKLNDSPWEDEVRAILKDHFEELKSGRQDAICAALKISAEDYAKVLAELRKLNPRPGLAYAAQLKQVEYVRPEVHALKTAQGTWKAVVDNRDLPQIRISPFYLKRAEDPAITEEERVYIKNHLQKVRALFDAIDHRQETIRKIAQAIFDAQGDFFTQGLKGIKPLTMDEIARKTGVHPTTVSRTVNSKYTTTPFGTMALRRFFASGLESADGTVVSDRAVKNRIAALVDAEDKATPLSDEKIAASLQAEGIQIARRTVAKYREALHIPGANDRRQKGEGKKAQMIIK